MFSFFYSSYEAWESGQILIIAIAIAYMRQMCAHRDYVAGVWRCCWLWQRRCRPPWGGTLPPGSCWMIPFRLWIFCLSISLRSGGENPLSTVGFSGRWSGGTLPCPWRRLWSRHSSNPPSGSRGSRWCSSSRRGVGRSRSTSWSEVHGRRIFRLKEKRQRWKKCFEISDGKQGSGRAVPPARRAEMFSLTGQVRSRFGGKHVDAPRLVLICVLEGVWHQVSDVGQRNWTCGDRALIRTCSELRRRRPWRGLRGKGEAEFNLQLQHTVLLDTRHYPVNIFSFSLQTFASAGPSTMHGLNGGRK